LAPANEGVLAIALPFTTEKCSDTWWNSTRQPHVPVAEGVPNTENRYISGSRIGPLPRSISFRMVSSCMICV
jgi:hypothetical protein